jgi:hypothetical protein
VNLGTTITALYLPTAATAETVWEPVPIGTA